MQNPHQALALRIYIGEQDKHEGRPLYRVLTETARSRGLAGCTVTRGLLGYGAASRIHEASILAISEQLPMIVEIVDEPEKIESFLPIVESLVLEGMMTMEKVQVLLYRHNRSGPKT